MLRSTAVFSAMTFLSRIAGYLRDWLQASLFGAGPAVSAFVVAYRIPNYLRRIFAEGSFSSAFVPVLSELKQRGDEAALQDFLDHVAGALLGVVVVVTGLGILLAPWIAELFLLFADESASDIVPLTAQMLRITFPYLTFISMTALAGAVLNTFRHFGLPALTPVLHNLGVIAGMLLLAGFFDVPEKALAVGVVVAGALQLLVLWPAMAKWGLRPRLKLNLRHEGVRRVFADDFFLFGVAGEPAGRNHIRLAAGTRRAIMAVLLRSPHRASARPVRGGDRHRDPAAAVAAPR
jgi:putative peptidoglycan lipid II flippase